MVPLASHPTLQREKKRVLFLYNELLRKRSAFTKLRRAAIVRRARQQTTPVSTVPSKPASSPQGLRTLGEGTSFLVHPAPPVSWARWSSVGLAGAG
ncbi:rCG62715, isoform CRA_c [Rattus norvegicus]|uniref:RCG62715, isoform CRA_c n=1 Tax=Rattus norvegicus TaxID=10116 RepID=A6J6F2_RAT|nr:rCG62715, isoform CRA_c [Rattus norvegicus]